MSKKRSAQKLSNRSPAEKVSFVIALSILSLIVGLVFYSWFTGENEPPILSVSVQTEIRQVEGQFYIPFKVTNKGGVTVESVQIIAELEEQELQEIGQQEFNFLSGGEVREGAFISPRDPNLGKLMIRVASYKLP
ncbi:MAG: TIGR02588 family protein [Spirulinaceae cyanobacterium]